tara:strand:- start:692 stop:799 length:108 start_codon:yes stop_codon:yes gene_type:complete
MSEPNNKNTEGTRERKYSMFGETGNKTRLKGNAGE